MQPTPLPVPAARAILAVNQNEESDMKRIKDMVDEANAVVTHAPAEEMTALHGQDGVTFVDLRDPRELERDGMIPRAFHCPRGMLEFWIDPESPYAKPQFQTGNRFVFYCASGWRSALSARTGFLKSNGEALRELKQNAISVNKAKVDDSYTITEKDLISGKFVLLQRGKKNYFVLVADTD